MQIFAGRPSCPYASFSSRRNRRTSLAIRELPKCSSGSPKSLDRDTDILIHSQIKKRPIITDLACKRVDFISSQNRSPSTDMVSLIRKTLYKCIRCTCSRNLKFMSHPLRRLKEPCCARKRYLEIYPSSSQNTKPIAALRTCSRIRYTMSNFFISCRIHNIFL